MREEFKETIICGQKYMVSNYGKVVGARGELSNRLDSDGYLCVTVGTENKRRKMRVHRLVASLFVNNEREEATEVNHIDFNRANPKATNLEWVTHKENVAKSVDAGNHVGKQRGTKNVKAILTEEDVADIKMLFDNNLMSQKELSVSYNVGWSTIHNVCFRHTWKHLI